MKPAVLASGLALAFTAAGPASAQAPAPWPSTCVCKSSDPDAFTTHYLALDTGGRDFARLMTRLAEIDYRPLGQVIAVPSLCPIRAVCTDQDKLPVDDADLRLKVLGYVADEGLVVDDRVQPDRFRRGAFLVLSGRAE